MTTTTTIQERLRHLGLNAAAREVMRLSSLAQKCAVAYEHYRFVTQDHIDKFGHALRERTLQQIGGYQTVWDAVAVVPLQDYAKVPPSSALDALEEAQRLGCFDTFEVAIIQSVRQVKDPILFGRIEGCPDRFFVAQWDLDISIDDLLQGDEGYVKAEG